ncbi:hypothetical protein PMAYCL1PPCAC_26341, partial [Pristionchus mayeri]
IGMAEEQVLIIDEWAQKAFALTISDNAMGNVLSKSLHLMSKVARNGVRAPNLCYALQSLHQERELAKILEQEPVDPLRELVLGMSQSLGIMISLLIEKDDEPRVPRVKKTMQYRRESAVRGTANVIESNVAISTPLFSEPASTSNLFQTPIKEEEPEEGYSGQLDTDAFSSAFFNQSPYSDDGYPDMDIKEEDDFSEPIFDYMPSWSPTGIHRQKERMSYHRSAYYSRKIHTVDQHIICPKCKHVYRTVRSFTSHLRKSHSTNMRKSGYVLRCDCGNESQSVEHADKCDIAQFTLLDRSESRMAKPKIRPKSYAMAPDFLPGSFVCWLEEHREALTMPGMTEDEVMKLAKTEWRKVEDKSKWYLEAGRRSKAIEKEKRASKQTQQLMEHSRRSDTRRSLSRKPEKMEMPVLFDNSRRSASRKPETIEMTVLEQSDGLIGAPSS